MYGFLIFILLALLWCCDSTKNTISEEEFFKAWSGTWVNSETPGSFWFPQKMVHHPDRRFGMHVYLTNTIPYCTHTFILLDQWTDSEGNIWFSAKTTCPVGTDIFYEYGAIRDSGNTIEFISREGTPIEKWEPEGEYYNYCIYYRE